MSILNGCQEGKQTPEVKEIPCPICKEMTEVFVKDGKTVGEAVCSKCGYKIPEGTVI